MEFARDLLVGTQTSANVKYYAEIVKEKSVLRSLIKLNEETANACYLENEPLDELLERTEKRVFELAENGNSQEYVPIKQVVLNALDVIEKAFVLQEDPTYSWKGDPGYIRSVTRSVKGGTTTTLAEGDNGTNSGWMYTFNGVHTDKAVNEQVVGDGDKIVLHYTDDYTLEAGMVYTPADVMERIGAIGEVTRLSGPAIDAARSAYDSLTDEEKAQVTNYKTLLDAEEAFRNLSSSVDWRTAYRETGTKLLDQVLQGKWTTGSVGGEWMMLGLARSERL